MSPVAELLREARRAGVMVVADGGDLLLRGRKAQIPADLVQRFRASKQHVLAFLDVRSRFEFNAAHRLEDLDRLSQVIAHASAGTGLLPFELRQLLSDEDLEDIIGGICGAQELRAYARSLAEGVRSGRVVLGTRR